MLRYWNQVFAEPANLGRISGVMVNTIAKLVQLPQGGLGLFLVAIFWPLNWVLPGLRTAYLFFPLWLGYILLMDALVLERTGTSLLNRSRSQFLTLFLTSAPAWWLFELINHRTRNWEYLGREQFSDFQYAILATISFSTVMPAVFETAEWVRSFSWIERFSLGPKIHPTPKVSTGSLIAGLIMLALTLAWPRFFYPFVWGSVFLILEPINIWLGRQHCFSALSQGDWRPLISLSAGALMCGFFWEMWNYYSYPKWIYHTPGVEFFHIFEMPLLGYAGYIVFAWELFALRNFLWRNPLTLEI